MLISKALCFTKVPGVDNLVILDTESQSHKLCIPSLAFVANNLYKTFEFKLDRIARRILNFSHAVDWVSYVDEVNDHVSGTISENALQIFNPGLVYHPLLPEDLSAIRVHNVGSSDNVANLLCPSDDAYGDDTLYALND